jgi:predicted O-methyltransferase YrrM
MNIMLYLSEAVKRANTENSDLSSHLDTLYRQTCEMSPKLIVELGVYEGQSTKIFDLVNREYNSSLISCDVQPPASFNYTNIHNGTFIMMDDIQFSNIFASHDPRRIDVLFIDTSHLYDHTVQEIKSWFPLLSDKALVMMHDTHLDGNGYYRKNGNKGVNWNNERGVIRAIEEYFGFQCNEKEDFQMTVQKDGNTWKIKHEHVCNGLTSLWKNPPAGN